MSEHNLRQLLDQIEPCNLNKPFIFISYSNKDVARVWNDVFEFQRRGYNIWLDEKNVDTKKRAWTDDALEAIKDIYCSLVVFYVSRDSLISSSCYKELCMTIDNATKEHHSNMPIPFIAIDLENIGNIVDFGIRYSESILGDGNIEKDKKTERISTLNSFIRDFFDNNDKVRIHPWNEINRKKEYYEDIINNFPEKCKINEEKDLIESVSPKKELLDYINENEIVIADQKFEYTKTLVEAAEKNSVMSENNIGEEIHEEKKNNISRQSVIKAIGFANAYIGKKQIILSKSIEDKRVSNAMIYYGIGATKSNIVGMLDTSFLKNGKHGFLITEDRVYSDRFNFGLFIDLNKLIDIEKKNARIMITYSDQTFFIELKKTEEVIFHFLRKIKSMRINNIELYN